MTESKPINPSKSKEELEAEQAAAKEQLDALLAASRPKHLGYGLASGVSNVVSGAVGGVGLAVMAPSLGLAQGAKQGGIIGGTVYVSSHCISIFAYAFVLSCSHYFYHALLCYLVYWKVD